MPTKQYMTAAQKKRQAAAKKGVATRRANAAKQEPSIIDKFFDKKHHRPDPVNMPGDGKEEIHIGSNLSNGATEDYPRMQTADREANKHLLLKAHDLINGDRKADYGEVRQNHVQIASGWQAMLSHKLMPGQVITAEDVVHCMITLKLVRLAKSPDHVDSQLDVAGYIGCEANIQTARKNGVPLLGATVDARDFGKK